MVVCARIMANDLPFGLANDNGGPDLRATFPVHGFIAVAVCQKDGTVAEELFSTSDMVGWCRDVLRSCGIPTEVLAQIPEAKR